MISELEASSSCHHCLSSMEVQLIQLSRISPGLVTSSILSINTSRRAENESNDVFPSICSTGRLMAFVSSYKAEFLACDDAISLNKSVLTNYVTSYEGLLHIVRDPMLPKPTATACLVVPFVIELRPGVSQTSSVVVVGFSDGYIKGYSKTGKSVFGQLLHPEPVVSLRVLCPPSSFDPTADKCLSSLVVLLKGKVVCVINGAGLTEEIKYNISKWNRDKFDNYSDSSDEQQRDPLSYKKFHLQDQSNISDVALSGQSTACAFDYLREASIVGGWDMTIRSGPTSEAKLISVGEQPMVALYRISKDAGTLNMSEVVHAVASRMTTAVLGKLSWLNSWGGGGAKSSASQTPTKGKTHEEKQQPKMNLPMNTNIPDPRRHVKSIVLSPVGNLAALVDGFGRVMLLDVSSLVIRRMWKGYRDAQCGWMVVSDPSDQNRQAQCLCIYATRRGILEFWSVQNGPRVAAFQIGKGCTLFHITCCLFGKEGSTLGGDLSSITDFGDRAVLLCADGRLLTFAVPFSSLIQCNSPESHDYHMILTLEQAITSGDQNLILEATESVKSYQVLQKVLQFVIDSYDTSSGSGVAKETIVKVFNIAVNKTRSLKDITVPEELHKHCLILRQLVQFYFNILELEKLPGEREDSDKTDTANSLSQFVQDSCKVSFQFAERMETLLGSYFQSCESPKSVRHAITLADLIHCFNLSDITMDCLLSSSKQSDVSGTQPSDSQEGEAVLLKDELSNTELIHLGEFIFKNILRMSTSSFEIESLFKESGINPSQLLRLLISVWTSGIICPFGITLYARSLYETIKLLLFMMSTDNADHWNGIQQIMASSCFPGHALLVTILCGYLSMDKSSPEIKIEKKCKGTYSQDEEEEGDWGDEVWETVTVDREEWARLNEMLELLTELAIVIGAQALKQLPAVLFIESDDDEGIVDIEKLKIKMLFGESSNSNGVCVLSLQETGPVLLGHCIGRSIVARSIPADLVVDMEKGTQKFSQNIRNITNSLRDSLSVSNLLVYCAFHAALEWSQSDNKTDQERRRSVLFVADYMTQIPSLIGTQGMCGFLWHFIFEKEITGVLKDKKEGTLIQDESYSIFLWVCRSIVSFLLKANVCQQEGEANIEQMKSKHDIINIGSPPRKMFLPAVVNHFPKYNSESLQACLQLFLVLEILQYSSARAINVFSFFPPSFASKWMKGIYRIGTETDVVHKNLQNKRTEFLNKSVSTIINNKQVVIKPTANFSCLKSVTIATQLYEFSDYTDIVFGLACLWNLKVDDIRTHWVANLFAAGMATNGKQVFSVIIDKNTASTKLLSLAGHFVNCLITDKDKQTQAMLFSHCSPGTLEWMRKQQLTSQQMLASSKTNINRTIVTSMLSLIRPHLQVTAPSHNEQILSSVSSLLKLL